MASWKTHAMMVEVTAKAHCHGCAIVILVMRSRTPRLWFGSGFLVLETGRLKSVALVAALLVTLVTRNVVNCSGRSGQESGAT